jgi:hypothetical protein
MNKVLQFKHPSFSRDRPLSVSSPECLCLQSILMPTVEKCSTVESESSMYVKAFREQIVRPSLKSAGLWSQSAENLMVGTAMVESGLNTLAQIGGGPGMSFFQIEPATYDDVIRYLKMCISKDLKARILSSCYMDVFPPAECSTWNLRLACLIARVKYYMQPEALPGPQDADEMAKYHKLHYNSSGGRTDISKSIIHFREACKG